MFSHEDEYYCEKLIYDFNKFIKDNFQKETTFEIQAEFESLLTNLISTKDYLSDKYDMDISEVEQNLLRFDPGLISEKYLKETQEWIYNRTLCMLQTFNGSCNN